jgi:hypothetical protein
MANSLLRRAFRGLDDALVGVAAILGAGIAMLYFPLMSVQEPQLGLVGLGLAVLGAFTVAFGSALALTGAASWFAAQLRVSTGNACLGMWLIILNRWGDATDTLPNPVITMGMFAGAVMLLGIAAVPGLLMGSTTERNAPWISRYIGRAGNLGALLLYPLWCIWLGRSLLTG